MLRDSFVNSITRNRQTIVPHRGNLSFNRQRKLRHGAVNKVQFNRAYLVFYSEFSRNFFEAEAIFVKKGRNEKTATKVFKIRQQIPVAKALREQKLLEILHNDPFSQRVKRRV